MTSVTKRRRSDRHQTNVGRGLDRRRPATALPWEIDLCVEGVLTVERLRKLLEVVYERLLVDIYHHRPLPEGTDEKLLDALDNAFIDKLTNEDMHRPPGLRLTALERLKRLAGACWMRVFDLEKHPTCIVEDLELLDALRDVVEGSEFWDWTIDEQYQLQFD